MTAGQFYKFGANILLLPMEHRTLFGVHRTVSGALAGAPRELAALWFSQRSSTKNHRTVWCATGQSGGTTSNGQLRPTIDYVTARSLKRQKSEDSLQRPFAPLDCPVRQNNSDFNGQPL
jgi:hypothetical protein